MGNSKSVNRFEKYGITYIPESPIPPHRSKFVKGIKLFKDGWKQEGSFAYGKFREGVITDPQGNRYKGTMIQSNYADFRRNLGAEVLYSWASVIQKGTVTDSKGNQHEINVKPYNMYESQQSSGKFYIGTVGDMSGIFEEDTLHNVVRWYLVVKNDKLKTRIALIHNKFLSDLLGTRRVCHKGKVQHEIEKTPDSDRDLLILHNLVEKLNNTS